VGTGGPMGMGGPMGGQWSMDDDIWDDGPMEGGPGSGMPGGFGAFGSFRGNDSNETFSAMKQGKNEKGVIKSLLDLAGIPNPAKKLPVRDRDPVPEGRMIKVEGLPDSISDDAILKYFMRYGAVEKFDREKMAVIYKTASMAKYALKRRGHNIESYEVDLSLATKEDTKEATPEKEDEDAITDEERAMMLAAGCTEMA